MKPSSPIPSEGLAQLLRQVQVNIPFGMLCKNLDSIIISGLQPEIYFNGEVLDHLEGQKAQRVAEKLRQKGTAITFHAPFMDLNPGAVDEKIREVTVFRFRQVMDLVPWFQPRTIVFHPGYDRFCYDGDVDLWLEKSLLTWRPLVEQAIPLGVRLAIENVFEENPSILKRLFTALDTPAIGYCLDAGHGHLFSEVPLEAWVEDLGPWLIETHLHDNLGSRDEHLPIGHGKIDFKALFGALGRKGLKPIHTIEPHQVEHLVPTLEGLAPFLKP
jgi:sugar phosphate isomerase/epimerase